MSDSKDYPLGYTLEEARRLADQGALLQDLTEEALRRAGLQHGMRVLDLGSGVGDVALLAARIVGAEGAVVGIERAASSVETARRRAGSLGVANIRFEQGDLLAYEPTATFDALIGRFVLLYLPDPTATLRRLSRHLRPGGIVAFQEYDMPQFAAAPPSALFTQVRRWILEAFSAAGAELEMGTKLYATFLRAGLPHPHMIAAAPVGCGPDSPAYEYVARVLRSLLPLVERAAIASLAQIDIDTLAERLRADAVAGERVVFLPRLVSAWTRSAQVP